MSAIDPSDARLIEKFNECQRRLDSGCIEWIGPRNRFGYGLIWYQGTKVLAHRVSLAIANGSIEQSDVVMHKCDHPWCVNPEHLSIGTIRTNFEDMFAKGRHLPGRRIAADKLRGRKHCEHHTNEPTTAIEYRAIVSSKKTADDLVGRRFGRLVVINRERHDKKHVFWRCLCDCGNETIVRGGRLRAGNTRSCGCLKFEFKAKGSILSPWITKTGVYATWEHIIQRCTNPNNHAYSDYGGRGIYVCDRWKKFANFYEDMGDRPEGMTLDRVDNSRGYELANCRWATKKEQMMNRRNTIFLTCAGETLALNEWAEKLSLRRSVLYGRLILGWSDEEIIKTPFKQRRKV